MKTALKDYLRLFKYYKYLGDCVLDRLDFEELNLVRKDTDNSIAIIAKHLAGNMLSRWTNVLTEDGEKPWRDRDEEFINNFSSKDELHEYWQKGWNCLFTALQSFCFADLEKIIYIRNEGHTLLGAINRQLAHYAYHVGQMIYIGKAQLGNEWKSLSIPIAKSKNYNRDKFSKIKGKRHFTDSV